MQNIIFDIMNQFGYLGIGFLIMAENIFPPIPSEVILTFGGFLTTYTKLNVWLVILFATFGSLAGAIVLYYIGRLIKPEYLKKILSGRIGKALFVNTADIDRAESWFDKRGNVTVLFCRFVPIVRSLISVPAGMAKMNLLSFLLYTTVGTAIWNTVLVWLGVLAADSWQTVVTYVGVYSSVVLLLMILTTLALGIIYFKRRIKR
ncbi:MAG: DedA family protein [Massilibacteroides sp.]|nr:DedA family protein [Massilibacteroides sp.]